MIDELPKGYAGFKKAISLKELFEKPTGLCVITGKNGSGKTKLLKYCYDKIREKNRNNRNIAIFREANYNWDLEEDEFLSFYRYKGKKNSSFVDTIFENIIDESKGIDNKEQLITILFSDNDYYKVIREKIGRDIFPKILKTFLDDSEITKITFDLGYPTDEDIKKEIDKKIYAEKKQQKYNYRRYKNADNQIKEEVEKEFKDIPEQKKQDYVTKINNNNKDKIDSTEKLVTRLMQFSSSSKRINTVIRELSELIYNDYIRSKKPENSIWAKINNDYLNKYEQFKYLLVQPHPDMSYSVSFYLKDKTDKSIMSFNDLSTGEKALFELFYYVYETSDEKLATNWIFLDELDANLNPEFIKMYIEILREIKKTKKIIITTHNPITVISAEPDEIFELDRDNSSIKRSKNKEDKRKILENLAPGFFIEDDFGYIGMALGGSADVITIFCEGENKNKDKNDKFYLENALDNLTNKFNKSSYNIISCGSESQIGNIANMFRKIPELGKLLKENKIVFLFDHDSGGFQGADRIVEDKALFVDNNYKYKLKIGGNDNSQAYALLLPTPDYLSDCKLSQKTGTFGYAIEHMHLVHSKEDYDTLISDKDNWDNKKKNFNKAVKDGIYTNYSNFERLFDTINSLFDDNK
jgi:energy-coupling factor transporter ATP-binding protein EcfA2